jgi:cytochrome c-type biogenesis protein CcmH/NrfG
LFATLALLVLVAAGVGAYFAFFRTAAPNTFEAAVAANLRGVGYMEQHEFPKAEAEFRAAVNLAPDWLPARINLGISMFNQQPADSKTLTQHVEESRDVFREVLRRDPKNLHARFCLGTLDLYVGKVAEAHEHFAAVYEIDPNDPHVLVRYATVLPDAKGGNSGTLARECYEKALKLDPYFNEARYRLAMAMGDGEDARKRALLDEHGNLSKADQYTESRIVYGEMGKYADVIGRDPAFAKPAVGALPMFAPAGKTALAPGTKWATDADLDALTRAARERFGAGVVLFDFDGDGKPDLLALSAGVRDRKLCDVLLKNEGNGTFTDISAALGAPRASLGAAPADYDNDGHPDLALTGAFGVRLLRNTGKGTFEDVSAAAGLDKLTGLFLGCGWYDFDPDGDLDLVLCKFADSVAALDAKQSGGTVLLFENVGVAPPSLPNAPNPALTTAFKRNDVFAPLVPAGAYAGFVASDLDGDGDTDLLLLADGAEPVFIENDRLMRFKRPQPAWLKHTGAWTGGLVFDANRDERSDLLLTRAGGAPVLLLSTGERDFAASDVNAPAFRQATVADVDADGWADVVGLSGEGKPVLLHNQGDGKLAAKTDAFGILKDVRGLAVANVLSDGNLDLLTLTDAGAQFHKNNGNGNHTLFLNPTGKRNKGKNERTSTDGFGVRISAHAGTHWSAAERATMSAGPAQSLLPTALGMGKHAKADLVRLHWPDLVLQAELGLDTGRVVRVEETNRKGTSCPVLMVWDGEKFAFVTDFLGGGALGESGPDGSVRPPRREESVKIEPGKLVPRNGEYVLKIAEPMDEVLYLDHLKLIAIDHPAGVQVFPDERFVFALPNATEKLMAFGTKHFPKRATDHRGADVTSRVLTRDRQAVDTFAVRSWLGYAEDHSLTLDFGTIPEGKEWALVLAGWTEYPYPESMFAATRAGVNISPPVLERRTPGGKWETVCDLGFPAGLPRTMTRPLPAGFAAGACELRIRTNMQVFWDQIYLAQAQPVTNAVELGVSRADLAARGFMQEVYPDGKPPVAYDDAKTEPVLVAKWKGKLTKLGDVTELLTADDDRYVLCGPGDEITVRFDASKLPALAPGFERSFVLRTRGYCKDTSSTTVSGGEVGPLPFRAMPNYPHFGASVPPRTDAERWHTRPAGR